MGSINVYQGSSIVDTTTAMQEETTASSRDQELLHSNGGGGSMKPVNPKETNKDVTTAVAATSVKQHQEGSNKIGDYHPYNTMTTTNTEQQHLYEIVTSLSPTIATTAEYPKMPKSSYTIEPRQGDDDSGNHVSPLGQQQYFGYSAMTTSACHDVSVSSDDALHDLCCMTLAKNKRVEALQKGSSSSSSDVVFSTPAEKVYGNNNSSGNKSSFSRNKRKVSDSNISSSTSSSSLPLKSNKEALSTMALRTSMKYKTMSKKRQILASMIRSSDQRYYESELTSALTKKNNAGASEVLANLRMGAALLDVCFTLKNHQEAIDREKRTCAALEKKVVDMGLVLPSSSEKEEVTTTTPPVKLKPTVKGRGVIDVLDQLYSRLLAAKAMSKRMEGCRLEEPDYISLFKTLKNFKRNAAAKMGFNGLEADAEANAEPEYKRRTVLSPRSNNSVEDASENGIDDKSLLDDGFKLTEGSSSSEREENESLIIPHVWKYYPLAYPPYNIPLLLSPLSRRPDFVVLALSDDNEYDEEEEGVCCEQQPTVVKNAETENDREEMSNYSSSTVMNDGEKGEKKSVGDMLDKLSLSRERHQWAQAFACQLRSATHATVNGRRTLMGVRDCVLNSLSTMDNEIEKLEAELVELRKTPKKLKHDISIPVQHDENLDEQREEDEKDDNDEEECVVISSDGNVVEIFERRINVNANEQQEHSSSKHKQEPSKEEEDDEDVLLLDIGKRKRLQVTVNKRSKVSGAKAKLRHFGKDLAIDTIEKRETRSKKMCARQMRLLKRARYSAII